MLETLVTAGESALQIDEYEYACVQISMIKVYERKSAKLKRFLFAIKGAVTMPRCFEL